MKTQIKQFDLYGKRNHKYDFLLKNNLKSINWNELNPTKPNHFFVEKDFSHKIKFESFLKLDNLFKIYNSGIKTDRDSLFVDYNYNQIKDKIEKLLTNNFDNDFANNFNIYNSGSYNLLDRIKNKVFNQNKIKHYYYRPFDILNIYYDAKIISRPGSKVFTKIKDDVLILNTSRTISPNLNWNRILISKFLTDVHFIGDQNYSFPLYLYPDQGEQGELIEQTRTPNLNMEIVKEIEKALNLKFTPEKNSPPAGGVAASADGVALSEEKEILTTINNNPIVKRAVHELPHNPKLRQLAIDKRKEGILSEVLFWKQVHKGKFHNIDFDRQRVIGSYIVDFYIKNLGLVVEIDGASHDNKGEYDEAREGYLKSLGLKIFKTYDKDIKKNIQWVMERLEDFIIEEFGEKPTPSASRHPSEGGELKNNSFPKNSPSERGIVASADEVVHSDESHNNDDLSSKAISENKMQNTFAPIDLLDYIYAVLHSPAYREKYKEFLKIDFPRVPYPNIKTFWKLVELGKQIREIHLLESPIVEEYITRYPKDGSNIIDKPIYKDGNVYINSEQYFEGVPEVAWNFYIGGYQPAQKWLKDRKGLELNFDDIMHYQKIIVALTETDRLMKEIDKVGVE